MDHRQQQLLLLLKPLLRLIVPALGTVPVLARVIAVSTLIALRAHVRLSAQHRRATLLDVASDADTASIRAFESTAARRTYNNAFALGVDANGLITWGGSYGQLNRAHAFEIALDFCAGAGGVKCKVVLANGSFAENDWLEVAKQLQNRPIEAVRKGFIGSLRDRIVETSAGTSGQGATGSMRTAFGYTFARSAAK